MQITITPLASAPGGQTPTPFVLCDDTQPNVTGPTSANPNGAPGLCKDGLVPKLSLATQRDELIGSGFAQELPRGNLQLSYAWKTYRVFDTTDNCAQFLRDHLTLIPTVGTLIVTIGTAPTQGYLYNAVLKDATCTEHTNISCEFSYSYAGSFVAPTFGAAGSGTGGPFTAS